jgi:hypothetical protein
MLKTTASAVQASATGESSVNIDSYDRLDELLEKMKGGEK